MSTVTTFLKQTYHEMKHVIWPSRKRAVVYALIVIVFSVAVGYLLFGFDQVFKTVMGGALS